jgi:8-oxo-dGTP pyrophosphatase MutT (NUDIX family)
LIERERQAALRARLRQRAQQPAPRDWLPVIIGGNPVGITNPDVASYLAALPRFALLDYQLVLDDAELNFAQRSEVLAEAALRLKEAGITYGWRDELLDIRPAAQAAPVAAVERAVCRTLGIPTTAVHLNAFTPDGALIVAQRSPRKAIDPGLWDNLVGGMVPSGENLHTALAREAREEAGLDLQGLHLDALGVVAISRPVPEGWMAENIHAYSTVLPEDTALANQDGEVAAIAIRDAHNVVAAIERDEFTLEAALVTLLALARGE